MLGSAVSSSTPTDFQPRSTIGFWEFPLMNCHAFTPGPTIGWPYCAVGMHSAVDSAIGLPRSWTSASRMLAFVTPPEVRRSFTVSPRCERGSRRNGDVAVSPPFPRTDLHGSDTSDQIPPTLSHARAVRG